MKKIRILLDYPCYPLWVYDEDGDLIDPMLPTELVGYAQIETLLDEIQQTYLSLFVNNKIEFRYVGFRTQEEENEFKEKNSTSL